MSDASKPWIEFDLPEDLGTRSFETLKEFEKWINEQRDSYRKAFQTNQDASCYDKGNESYADVLRELKQTEESHPDDTTGLRRKLKELFDVAPPVGTRASIHLERIANSYPESVKQHAAYFIQYVYQNGTFPANSEKLNASVLGQMYLEKIPYALQEELIESAHARFDKHMVTTSEKCRQLESQLQELYDAKKVELERLEDNYKQIRELEEPQEYWTKKESAHRNVVWLMAACFALALIVGGCLLIDQAENVAWTIGRIQDPKPYHWLANAIPLFVVGIGLFWVLRILARVMFQQLHLLSDSSERAVMVNTYLALLVGKGVLDGKQGVNQDSLNIILSQLFRHGQQGLKLEDAAPPTGVVNVLTGDGKQSV